MNNPNPTLDVDQIITDTIDRVHGTLHHIPDYMHEGIMAYLKEGRQPGDFLQAVLENNLHKAVARADTENQMRLTGYAIVLDRLPFISWGSEEKVTNWINQGGLKGHFKYKAPNEDTDDGGI